MPKLDPAIICPECKTVHSEVPDEEDIEAPVHCSECGALMGIWGDILHINVRPEIKQA